MVTQLTDAQASLSLALIGGLWWSKIIPQSDLELFQMVRHHTSILLTLL